MNREDNEYTFEPVEAHDPKGCPLCSEKLYDDEGNYRQSKLALRHTLENMVAKGLLQRVQMEDGKIGYEETKKGRERARAILESLVIKGKQT